MTSQEINPSERLRLRSYEEIRTDVWYPHSVPADFSHNGSMSTLKPTHLDGKSFDHVIIGGGIGGLLAAYQLRTQTQGSIVVIDGGKFFGEQSLSAISGGEISIGLGVGNKWGIAGLGEETYNEFLRHTMVSARMILGLADGFKESTGCTVKTSDGLVVAITNEEMEAHVREDAEMIKRLVEHDSKYRPVSNGVLSVSSLKAEFGRVAEIAGNEIMGGLRYRLGINIPGEGAVNPGTLGVALRYLARGEINIKGEMIDPSSTTKVDFVENIHANKISPDGTIYCSLRNGHKVTFSGKNVILAGVSPHIIEGVDMKGEHKHLATEGYRTMIAMTEPVPHLADKFKTAVHDTTKQYNYVWIEPVSKRLMWGTGDFKLYPAMSKEQMVDYARNEIAQALGSVPKIEHLWEGDIPYAKDGFPILFKKGNVMAFGAPGGNGLAASAALATITAKAALGDEHAQELFENMQKRQPGFDPVAISKKTPDYLKSAPFKFIP